jgi:prepilin-type processing-associated H-X9-DG protein
MVFILPYIDQGAIYQRWVFNTHSGYTNNANLTIVRNITIPVFRCPSSPVPDLSNRGGAAGPIMNVSYTAIAGYVPVSTSAATNATNAAAQSYRNGCCNGNGSWYSIKGCMYGGSKTTMVGITDGTSNTWLIGEQSDYTRDSAGSPITAGYTMGVGNSGGLYGWTMGAQHPVNGIWSSDGADGRSFNTTTIRYQINQRGLANSAANGTNNDVGMNFPLNSGHTGGVNILFADGTVRFYTNSTPLNPTMWALSTRAGGETVSIEQ